MRQSITMIRAAIPEVLFSSIKEEDPYKASKLFQIERWCYANWRLHQDSGRKIHYFLAQVLSSDDCWQKVDNVHGVKLDRRTVGKKLVANNSNNPFNNNRDKKYEIACRYCLEEDIIALFEERKEKLSAQCKSSLMDYGHLVKSLSGNVLIVFWSHFISGYISKLNLDGRNPYEYGLTSCAMSFKQEQAVEFFLNKIKSLPESEMSEQEKDGILMKTAVYAAGNRCNGYPEIFEFCFGQMNPDRYPELLRRDLAENGHYGSLNTLQSPLRFDQFQVLFDHLKPNDVSEEKYHLWLQNINPETGSNYAREGVRLFMHMWTKEGFDSHRALVLKKEVCDRCCFLTTSLLIPWVNQNYMEPVWAVLSKASPHQVKEFMDSRQAEYIQSVLAKRDIDSLYKFLSFKA